MIVSGLNDCSDDGVSAEQIIKITAWNILEDAAVANLIIGRSLECKMLLGLAPFVLLDLVEFLRSVVR
jgi:hypothetical protein